MMVIDHLELVRVEACEIELECCHYQSLDVGELAVDCDRIDWISIGVEDKETCELVNC